jgi:hypothetical protein
MNIAKCPRCDGKGYRLRKNDNDFTDTFGELEKYPCITPCYDGKIRYEKLNNNCDRCNGDGRVKYSQDTGSIIPSFRTKTWYEQCKKCLGTGKEIQIYFKCYDCKDGYRTLITRERGLLGWREVEKKSKCGNCGGVGYTLAQFDLTRG